LGNILGNAHYEEEEEEEEDLINPSEVICVTDRWMKLALKMVSVASFWY
jgi:hypothetical protein